MADMMGRDALLTFPGTNDFGTGIVLKGHVVRWNMRRAEFDTTHMLDVTDRISLGNYSGSLSVRCWIDSTSTKVPIIPSGTNITVTIKPGFATGAADTWSITCLVVDVSYEFATVNGGPPQTATYSLRTSATGSDGTAAITYTDT